MIRPSGRPPHVATLFAVFLLLVASGTAPSARGQGPPPPPAQARPPGPPGGAATLGASPMPGGRVPIVTESPVGMKTRPELTGYAETSRYEDVVEFMKRAAASSPLIHLTTMGYTFEGRPIPMAVVGRVADASPAAVLASGKTRVYVQGNIHAGEVEGKEACLEILRDLSQGRHRAWLDSMVLLIAPIYNADGNERVALTNRGTQHGPVGGMGQRANAQDYDLNRDFMKVDAPESRSFALMMARWDPHVAVDLHTTNGSFHAYRLTYAPPLHPLTAPGIASLARERLLPAVTAAVKAKDGWDFYYYGNTGGGRPGAAQAERAWSAAELSAPRYSNNFIGLRNRIGILGEIYSYLPFKERIAVARRFTEEILAFVQAHGPAVRQACEEADRAALSGRQVAVTGRALRSPEPVEILMGEVATERNPYTGQLMRRRLDVSRPERMPVFIAFEAAETTRAPRAYLVPAALRLVADRLDAHGIRYAPLGAEATLAVERFRITANTAAEREYQRHRMRTIGGAWEPGEERLAADTLVVPVDQPLGRLVVLLLEPASEDGLGYWNLMDEVLGKQPAFYPVFRTDQRGGRQ